MSPGRGKKSALQICNKPYCSTCQSYITAPTPAVTATAATVTSPTITATSATTPTATALITATVTPTSAPTPTATTTPTAITTTITVLLLRNDTLKI